MDEHIYLKIPSEYVCIFNKLIIYLADLGKELIDDCSTSCKNRNKLIIDCWNVFQLAVSNKLNGKDEVAKYFIDYIEKQLANISNVPELGIDVGVQYYPIDDKGRVTSSIDCNHKTIFIVNEEGTLQQVDCKKVNPNDFYIEDNKLMVKYKEYYASVYTKFR